MLINIFFIIFSAGFFMLLTVALGYRFVFAETFIINAGGGGEPLSDETNQFLSPLREVERLGTENSGCSQPKNQGLV